jgi:hypothetical protein
VKCGIGSIIYASVPHCYVVWDKYAINYLVTKFLVKTVRGVPVKTIVCSVNLTKFRIYCRVSSPTRANRWTGWCGRTCWRTSGSRRWGIS